jgi:HAMP domain-containing protein
VERIDATWLVAYVAIASDLVVWVLGKVEQNTGRIADAREVRQITTHVTIPDQVTTGTMAATLDPLT